VLELAAMTDTCWENTCKLQAPWMSINLVWLADHQSLIHEQSGVLISSMNFQCRVSARPAVPYILLVHIGTSCICISHYDVVHPSIAHNQSLLPRRSPLHVKSTFASVIQVKAKGVKLRFTWQERIATRKMLYTRVTHTTFQSFRGQTLRWKPPVTLPWCQHFPGFISFRWPYPLCILLNNNNDKNFKKSKQNNWQQATLTNLHGIMRCGLNVLPFQRPE